MRKIAFYVGLLMCIGISVGDVAAQARPTPTDVPGMKLPRFEAGDSKIVSEPIDRDLFVAGGQVQITSNITGDAYVAGGQPEFKGTTTGNLIMAGGDVNITGNIGGNLIVAGGQVRIAETARVAGYVLAAGGQVNLDGTFSGPVKVASGKLNISNTASVAGNLEADTGEATVSDQATISGEKLIRVHERKDGETSKKIWAGVATAGSVIYLFSNLLSLFVLIGLFKWLVPKSTTLIKNLWPNIGLGLVVAIVTPILAIILMATLIGLPLGMILLAIYLIAAYLSTMVVAAGLGGYISERGWVKTNNPYVLATIGLVLVGIAVWLPLVGWLAKLIVGTLGIGMIYRLLTTQHTK